jgi:site-specific DNA-methyltransferase (adenine-specific)
MNDVRHVDALGMLRGLDAASVPLIITDPPYGIGYHSNHYKDKNPHAPIANDWNFQISAFLAECSRVLKDGGALYMFCRWDVTPLWMPYISGDLKLKTVVVWVKDNWSAGDLTGSFGNQYEQMLFITKGRHKLRGKRWSNVWEFPRVPARKLLHPAQKPVDLLQRAILASSDEGDVVVDPFAGSGSTGEAAQLARREYLLGDVDAKMVALARKRLGLSVLDDEPVEAPEPVTAYHFEPPDPSEWGVHPEDLAVIRDELKHNIQREIVTQLTLPLAA